MLSVTLAAALDISILGRTAAAAALEQSVAQVVEPPATDADPAATRPRVPARRYRVSPTSATLQSLALPGLGQFRAGEPVRGALAFAVESYLVTRSILEHTRAGDDRDRASAAAAVGNASARSAFLASAELHEERRGELFFWTGIAHMFNMLDAYVAAHLSLVDDEIDSVQRLTFNASPSLGGGETLTVTWNF